MKDSKNSIKIGLIILLNIIMLKKVLKLSQLDLPLILGYSALLFMVLFFVNVVMFNKYGSDIKTFLLQKPKALWQMVVLTTFINFLSIILVTSAIKSIDFYLIKDHQISFVESGGFKQIINYSFLFSVAIGLYLYVKYSDYEKESQIEQQRVITGNVSAQFESLKNQLDPHFLFNSLNVLGALIEEDPEKAILFNHSLSKTYRYILDQKNKDLVPLKEELEFAKMYIELLKMRFEDSLIFNFPSSVKQEGALVVPLSLQLLLENVIKHNKASRAHPLIVTIEELSSGYLKISNNLNKKQLHETRKGIGLENIASRYSFVTSRPVKISYTEQNFEVEIPILTKIIEHMKIIDVPEQEQELLIQAKQRVEELKKFYSHLTVYIMVNTFLMILNLITDDNFLWFLIVVFAWGIGIVSHGMRAYNYSPFLGKDWEDRKIREFMERNNKNGPNWQ